MINLEVKPVSGQSIFDMVDNTKDNKRGTVSGYLGYPSANNSTSGHKPYPTSSPQTEPSRYWVSALLLFVLCG